MPPPPPNFLPFAPSRPIFGKNFRSTTPPSKCVRPPQYELEDFCSVNVLAWSKDTKIVDKRIPSIMIQIFSPNVCVTRMSYKITVTIASEAWQGHCWICILPNRLVNIITIWRLEHLLNYEKKWEGRSNQLVLEEHPFSYVLDIGMACLWYGFISVIERGPDPPSKKYQNINL